MRDLSIYDELDQAIDQFLHGKDQLLHGKKEDASNSAKAPRVADLLALAAELRHLPGANFKARLKLELEWEAAGRGLSAKSAKEDQKDQPMNIVPGTTAISQAPGLFGKPWGGYPVRKINFALSAGLHAIMILLVGAGFLMVKSIAPRVELSPRVSVTLEPYPAQLGNRESHGGGSGGAAERLKASLGAAPRAAREQLTPPVVLRNTSQPRLVAEATVIAPPDLAFPQTRQIGDPLSDLTRLSNGPGAGSGMGGNAGGGVGGESGPGRGPGAGGGCCGGLYSVGNGVSMPRAIYAPEPEFSEEARKSKYQGEVTLLATIGADGLPKNLTVVRSLGMGLDEKAMETVRTWRFDPARKDGHPVAVQMNIIVNFHLF